MSTYICDLKLTDLDRFDNAAVEKEKHDVLAAYVQASDFTGIGAALGVNRPR